MKITVYQAKGGAGKTPIATNIALDREYAIGTNEAFHLYDTFIPDDLLLSVDLSEAFPTIPEGKDIVFDLAGAISSQSHSITSALRQSDIVLVPIQNEVKSLHSGLLTVREIERISGFHGQIVIVATKLEKTKKDRFTGDAWTESGDFLNIESAARSAGFSYPIIPLKFSKAYDAIFEREMSIADICAADPLAAYSFRDALRQFQTLYDTIDEMHHAQQEQPRRA